MTWQHTIRSAPVLALLAATPAIWGQQQQVFDPRSVAPYVPSPPMVVERMLAIADVKPKDVVYDLGSGDGRIVISAAQDLGARAVGVELNATLAEETSKRIKELGLDKRARIIQGDLHEVDLSEATVVTLYLLSASNLALKPIFEKQLKPGTRIVSHDFVIMGWTPVKTDTLQGPGRTHTIYLYEIGQNE